MLTGCRSGETLSLRWKYVDLDMGELKLSQSKTGAKVVHLGDPAIAVLRGIPRIEDNPWVLPGMKSGKHLRTTWQCTDTVQGHTLRLRLLSGRRTHRPRQTQLYAFLKRRPYIMRP